MLSTLPTLWTDPEYYGENIGIGGLNYISLGLGALLGSLIAARLNDYAYASLKAHDSGLGKSECRLPLLAITSICCSIGLFIYGWTAQSHQPWIAPNIGACIFDLHRGHTHEICSQRNGFGISSAADICFWIPFIRPMLVQRPSLWVGY
ncbi:MFS multidrug transporter [Penicillium angulare]|uniref:MFS multidrug transporter n=1 Tax=Penicillium angulare TaxID=116970 RepID=UPI00253F73D4|nr:MFS multidrug transporter [Penicillium angulare]KAJ5274064.1 MFS multidrug transporter [Penicillium angulare]